ncbi:MAG TPA: hypothetical protein DCO75_10155 [Fibrobacteres bacterium]|nr:hypothetical protein [Fibrobacterota bacterium]
MYLKSNAEYWNELFRDGKVFSYIKDGMPESSWQHLVALAYPVTLIVMISISLVFMKIIRPSQWKWKTYFFSIFTGTATGGLWCLIMLKSDPAYPGWLFAPWSATGFECGLTLEDWLFLPASTTLFYSLYRWLHTRDYSKKIPLRFHEMVICFYGLISLVTLLIAKTAGRMEIVMFIIPGMVLYWYVKDSINFKKFIYLQLFVVFFEVFWDLFAVSFLHYIPGLSWASQWTYISFNAAGKCFHSNIFIDHSTNQWAWILMNPIEITPLFGICGGLFNAALFTAGDVFFYFKHEKSGKA